jgi:eukaryotic-like serine/threonine-protein kinase
LSTPQTQIGRYRLDSVIGSGGMAVVHLGYDSRLGRPVAVKLLADNLAARPDFRRRFLREARLAAALSHPNIVQVYDTGEDGDGRPYIVMEYVEGESLAAMLARERRLAAARVSAVALDCCAGLGYAHAAGLVHRDIKPHNLLVGTDGAVKIADFGVARSLDGESLTVDGSVLGTAGYLAPEQARGEPVTAAADIYALGATLWQLLTGVAPTAGAAPRPTAPPDVPEPMAAALTACLDPEPLRRPSAEGLAAALTGAEVAATRVMDADPATAPTRVLDDGTVAPSPRIVRRQDPRRTAIAAAIVALLLAVAVIAIVAGRSGGGAGNAGAGHRPAAHKRAVAPPVPGADTSQSAQNLAAWIRDHSGG